MCGGREGGGCVLQCTRVSVPLPVRVVGVILCIYTVQVPDLSECTLELIHTQLP